MRISDWSSDVCSSDLLGVFGITDPHRHARFAARRNAVRMQHLGAGAGDFLTFLEVQPGQQAGIGHLAWIGAEHARHVGPYLYPTRMQQRTQIRRRSILTPAPETRGDRQSTLLNSTP